MIIKTSSEARRRLSEALDMAQREPVAITRHGKIVAYIISPQLMEEWISIKRQRGVAVIIRSN
jgi:prevent-host-death family protein